MSCGQRLPDCPPPLCAGADPKTLAARMLLQGLNSSWNRDAPFPGAGGRHEKGMQCGTDRPRSAVVGPSAHPAVHASSLDRLSPPGTCAEWSGACCLEHSTLLCRHTGSLCGAAVSSGLLDPLPVQG